MRSRASYRPDLLLQTAKKVEKIEQNVVKNMRIKRKSSGNSVCDNKTIKVITIDDSDQDEGIETIAVEESSDEKQVIQRCEKCLDSLDPVHDYNCLTSADFYLNSRVHPSAIAGELRDSNRYNAYKNAILQNKHLFTNKVVLSVGSGVGLLALFAAKAGAQTVIVIDKKEIIQLIQAVIKSNAKTHNSNIIVMNDSIDKIENIVLPNGIEKVDIIVSDWANHLIFYKSSIRSFIHARDKWLKPNGLIFPDSGNIYLVGAHDNIHLHLKRNLKYSRSTYVKRIDWWSPNVYGFDMTSVRRQALVEPIHESIDISRVVTKEFLLKNFNFYDLTLNDINFSTTFELKAIKRHYLQMFAIFFEVIFIKNIAVPHMFSTRPNAPKTCFKPTLLFIDNDKELTLNKNDKMTGNLCFSLDQDLNRVSIDIDLKLTNNTCNAEEKFVYRSA